MLIAGTGGQAMDTLDVLAHLNQHEDVCFFNNLSKQFCFEQAFLKYYRVITDETELNSYFKTDPLFLLGTGNPAYRRRLYELMLKLGGKPYTLISSKATVGKLNNQIGEAVSIMNGVVITINTSIGKGCLINTNATLTHDDRIGDFVEIGPGASVAGACTIGDNAFIGTGAVILPKISVGHNAVVAAGAVVIENVPPFTMVAGNPAVIKKKLG